MITWLSMDCNSNVCRLPGPEDIPKAIVLHEVIGLGFAIGFWSICYTSQPSKTFMRPVANVLSKRQSLERIYTASFVRAERTVQSSAWLKRLPMIGRCVPLCLQHACLPCLDRYMCLRLMTRSTLFMVGVQCIPGCQLLTTL